MAGGGSVVEKTAHRGTAGKQGEDWDPVAPSRPCLQCPNKDSIIRQLCFNLATKPSIYGIWGDILKPSYNNRAGERVKIRTLCLFGCLAFF